MKGILRTSSLWSKITHHFGDMQPIKMDILPSQMSLCNELGVCPALCGKTEIPHKACLSYTSIMQSIKLTKRFPPVR